MEMPQVYRPVPRRAFEITPASADSSMPPSPGPENMNSELLMDRRPDMSSPPSRTRSILNLTSSTLFGIYSPTGQDGNREDASTPWGTGAQTPSHRKSLDDDHLAQDESITWNGQTTKSAFTPRRRRVGFRGYWLPLALQTTLLFSFGVSYGFIIERLQETQKITPIPLPNVERGSTYYHIVWGMFGVLAGNALPLVDGMWEAGWPSAQTTPSLTSNGHLRTSSEMAGTNEPGRHSASDSSLGPFWYSAVRSIGAFVGVAFAVRRIPWQSTLQLSLTLALANPVLWYLIDRSMPGFAFSSLVSVAGTFILLLVDPNFVPVPAIHQAVASEQIGVYAWLASILFCTSLCFGAIGRRLQL